MCQAECDAAAECVAWTYVIRGEPAGSGDCCLKKMAPTGNEPPLSLCPATNDKTCTSGFKVPTSVPAGCGHSPPRPPAGPHDLEAQLGLLPADKSIEVRIFVDHVMMEVFFMDGRVALTTPLAGTAQEDAGFTLFSGWPTQVTAGGWQVGEIWVTPESLL